MVRSLHWLTLTVFNSERTAKKKNSSLRFFVSLLLSVRVSIYTQLSVQSLSWNSPRSSRKNDCVHCLSSCTIRSLSFLSGLSLYWNNIFIENSFCAVLSKSQRVKLLGKSKRRPIRTFPSQKPFQWFLRNSRDNIQALHHTVYYIDDWFSYAAVLFIYFLNQPTAP